MKRFVACALLFICVLAFAVPAFPSTCDDERNVPEWALQIRDTVGADYMAVYALNGYFARHKELPRRYLDRALGDFSRETSYACDRINLAVMRWDKGGDLSFEEMRKLQGIVREAVSRHNLKLWPK